jgi:hypothetical protein
VEEFDSLQASLGRSDLGHGTLMTRGPAYDPDAVDLPGSQYRSSALASEPDNRWPPPGRYIRTVNGPIDLDDPPPMASNVDPIRTRSRRPPAKKRTLQSSRAISTRRKSARPWLVCVAGGLIFVICFATAMRSTRPQRPPTPAMTALAGAAISDLRSLMAAVKVARLRGAPDVKGAIEELTRLDDDHVTLKGWATDVSGGGSPLTVMVFVDGRNTLTMETAGRRPQIGEALGLSDAAAANVSFQGNLTCSRGQKLIVVAVAPSDVYGHFGTRLCP